MTQEERERKRAYDREYNRKRYRTEEQKELQRQKAKVRYYRDKELKALKEAEREENEKLLPKAPDILKDDCCRICKHFSSTGLKEGWCMKKKKSTQVREICGQFSPMTEEKFVKVIYKTPGVKYIKGND